MENKDTMNCKFCLALTPEQLAQISTPSYKLKKEKQEARKAESATPTQESCELVDSSSVSVIGVVARKKLLNLLICASRKESEKGQVAF